MKKIVFSLTFLVGMLSFGQQEEKTSFSAALVSDTFFGFAPVINVSYELSEKSAFTAYGIFWSGGTGLLWGNWAEFGAGANFSIADGVKLNPQLGFTKGNLLSSLTEGPSVFGDGIVPNLTLNLDQSKLEGQLYFGYYLPLRNEGSTTSNYIHYWANLGYKASSFVSFGAHFEHLYGGEKDFEDDVYQWIGPYVQFSDLKGRGYFRISGGLDLIDTPSNNSFYKMAFGINL